MKRIVYGKIGKSTSLDPSKWGAQGGDNEPLYLLLKLAERHLDVEWVFGSRYRKGTTDGLPANVVLPPLPEGDADHALILRPYYEDADGVIMWLGPHAEANRPDLPQITDRSKFVVSMGSYERQVAPVLRCINAWRDQDPLTREEVWLCPDTRIPLKARDLKWPLRYPILSQYPNKTRHLHERYGDNRPPEELGFPDSRWHENGGVWISENRYTVDGLEIVGIPPDWKSKIDWADRTPFCILTNETKSKGVQQSKPSILHEWTPWLEDGMLRGSWTDEGARKIGLSPPTPCPFSEIPIFLGGAKSTFVTPTSGEGWPTLKMHEAFVLGAVCFFHPLADDRGAVIPTRDQTPTVADAELKWLAEWLRPPTPAELHLRVKQVHEDRETYERLRNAQLRVEARFLDENRTVRTIENRVGLGDWLLPPEESRETETVSTTSDPPIERETDPNALLIQEREARQDEARNPKDARTGLWSYSEEEIHRHLVDRKKWERESAMRLTMRELIMGWLADGEWTAYADIWGGPPPAFWEALNELANDGKIKVNQDADDQDKWLARGGRPDRPPKEPGHPPTESRQT